MAYKKCPSGKVRSRTTHRCHSAKLHKSKCKKGKVRSRVSGRCISRSTLSKRAAGIRGGRTSPRAKTASRRKPTRKASRKVVDDLDMRYNKPTPKKSPSTAGFRGDSAQKKKKRAQAKKDLAKVEDMNLDTLFGSEMPRRKKSRKSRRKSRKSRK